MTSESRREAILRAVVPIFSQHGFRGATTRMLAKAAGVSEALLYRHFPSKEALYEEIGRQHIADDETNPAVKRLLAMPPGSPRLIATVQYLIAHVHYGESEDIFPRLIAQSLLEDGSLARSVLGKFREELLPFMKESIEAASRAGDFVKDAIPGEAEFWLLQHLTFAVRLHRLPDTPVIDSWGGQKDQLDRTIRFALRGMGLRRKAIAEHYNADLLRSGTSERK